MKKLMVALVLIASLGSCSFKSSSLKSRALSSEDSSEQSLDCESIKKGCLIKRQSNKLIVFFRGWVSPHMANRYGGSRKAVAQRDWVKAARDLINEDMRIGSMNVESSVFVLGSAHVGLSEEELFKLMEESGASEIILAAHSGGYKGMRATIKPMPLEFWSNVSGIWLLDNYYGGASFAQDLKRNFGENFLVENCYGFYTDHNRSKFKDSYESFCPKTLGRGVSHSGGVSQCMPYFEKGQECVP